MLDNALPLFTGDSVPELIQPFRAIAQSLDSILQIPRIPFVEATLTHREIYFRVFRTLNEEASTSPMISYFSSAQYFIELPSFIPNPLSF